MQMAYLALAWGLLGPSRWNDWLARGLNRASLYKRIAESEPTMPDV
jgi:hypothetical protein